MSDVFSMFFETQQSELGYLFLDVLTSEQLSLPSEVTKYPVEDGSDDISDHITKNNEELTIQGAVSGDSFGLSFVGGCTSKLIDAIDQLRSMHMERQPIEVTTGLGTYYDMAFTSLQITRSSAADKGGNWLEINAQLRKIKKVELKEAELPSDTSKASDSGGAKGKTGKTKRPAGKSGESKEEGGLPKSRSKAIKDGDIKASDFNPFSGK